jgi:UreF-like urease accessory protein
MNELYQVVSRCNPSLDLIRALTWDLDGDAQTSWLSWLGTVFEPLLLPHLGQVLEFASRQSLREVVVRDVDLHRYLPPKVREPSISAGRLLLQAIPPRGDRLLARLQDAVDNGTAVGHFATLYAVRAAAFSIPTRTAILAYLWQELVVTLPEDADQPMLLEKACESVNQFLRTPCNGLTGGLRFHG